MTIPTIVCGGPWNEYANESQEADDMRVALVLWLNAEDVLKLMGQVLATHPDAAEITLYVDVSAGCVAKALAIGGYETLPSVDARAAIERLASLRESWDDT